MLSFEVPWDIDRAHSLPDQEDVSDSVSGYQSQARKGKLTEDDIVVEMADFTDSCVSYYDIRWIPLEHGLCKVEELEG